MAENIVNTYNLYIDTSRGHSADSQGDNFNLNLGHAGIVCEEGQYIRLTLNNFSMHKNFTDINDSNNKFRIQLTKGGTKTNDATLTKRNNTTLNALADDFADKMARAIETAATLTANSITIGNVTPSSTTSVGGDSDHIISFTLTLPNSHGITAPKCFFFLEDGDSYEILGGDRIEDKNAANPDSSITMALDTNTITVTCKYPAQRQTIEHVYLRCLGVPNTSIETIGLLNPAETHRADTTDSDILAKIPVDVEYCNYDAQSGREYFMNVRQKVITNLRLRLTDRHNRFLGREFNQSGNTASGTGTLQSVLGNLSFSAVIRVDVVQQRHPKHLETPPVPELTATRFEQVLSHPKFGRQAYGTGVGKWLLFLF